MRFDKKSRKLRSRKSKKKSGTGGLAFWIYLAGGLALLGFFLVILYGGHQKQLRKVRRDKIREDMDSICAALTLFYQERGRYPTTREGIDALLSASGNGSTRTAPGGRMLDRIPLDPWRNPYRYQGPAAGSPSVLTSFGKDRKPGGQGEAADVIRKGCRSREPVRK